MQFSKCWVVIFRRSRSQSSKSSRALHFITLRTLPPLNLLSFLLSRPQPVQIFTSDSGTCAIQLNSKPCIHADRDSAGHEYTSTCAQFFKVGAHFSRRFEFGRDYAHGSCSEWGPLARARAFAKLLLLQDDGPGCIGNGSVPMQLCAAESICIGIYAAFEFIGRALFSRTLLGLHLRDGTSVRQLDERKNAQSAQQCVTGRAGVDAAAASKGMAVEASREIATAG
ncbi:hypothetical protein C8R45DRAFT_1025638 [Mycena sanguinolenta]|nr:hypothetical protein C8R45DRAFT_1025638 [Mycena sanguinolenta]